MEAGKLWLLKVVNVAHFVERCSHMTPQHMRIDHVHRIPQDSTGLHKSSTEIHKDSGLFWVGLGDVGFGMFWGCFGSSVLGRFGDVLGRFGDVLGVFGRCFSNVLGFPPEPKKSYFGKLFFFGCWPGRWNLLGCVMKMHASVRGSYPTHHHLGYAYGAPKVCGAYMWDIHGDPLSKPS